VDGYVCSDGTRNNTAFKGKMTFSDRFDLDPIYSGIHRSPEGERRTRIGYILALGTDFNVTSDTAIIYQHAFRDSVDIVAKGNASVNNSNSSGDL